MRSTAVVWIAALLMPMSAGADPAQPPTPPSLPVLESLPPVRTPGETALWPASGLLTVRLWIELSADGTVLSVQAPADLPPAFKHAALDAAWGARFQPAIDPDGVAVDARIQLEVLFDRSAPPPTSIEGQVREAGGAGMLSSVQLEATRGTGGRVIATTNAAGRFAFVGLDDGTWTIYASGRGLQPVEATVEVRAGAVQALDLRMIRDEALTGATIGAEIVVRRPETGASITERALSTELARVLPGTNGDVVKVIQSLPGVARSPMGTGNLIIRGTAPDDSMGFIDGTPLPMVFHFGGVSTVIHGRSVAEVGYVPGNAGVRYGRFLGGLVDIRTRETRPEHPERAVHVDLYQAGLFVDAPVGEQSALTVAARRSYIDTLLQGALDARAVPVRAPVFADTQARWLRVFDDGTRTEVLLLYSHDTFEYLGIEDGEESAAVDLDLQFWRVRGRLLQPVGSFTHELSITVGVDTESIASFSRDDALEQVASVSVREEWYRPASEQQLGMRLGLDLWSGREVFLYNMEDFGPFEGGATEFYAPALYGELSASLGRFTATPGLRGDLVVYPHDAIAGSLDPRVHTRFDLDEAWSIVAATGTYSRLPAARRVLSSSDGNPALLAERSWQNSLGVEFLPVSGLRFELTGFANFLDRRIVGREDRFQFTAGTLLQTGPVDDSTYENSGTGDIFGTELLARVDRPRFTGWLAATLSRSRRTDRPGEAPTRFDYDQPVVLTALGTTPLPRNWRLGGRVRRTSGNPYTPVANRFQDMESRQFIPVYGTETTERLAPFTALDLRVDKTYTFPTWRLTTSLDVQNIALRPNPEIPAWNNTYTEFTPITGLPPIPVFGLEGSW